MVFTGFLRPVSTNKTDRHDMTEILVLLKVVLDIIAITTTLHASDVECVNTTTHQIVGTCTGHVIKQFRTLHYALDATWKERHRVDFQLCMEKNCLIRTGRDGLHLKKSFLGDDKGHRKVKANWWSHMSN